MQSFTMHKIWRHASGAREQAPNQKLSIGENIVAARTARIGLIHAPLAQSVTIRYSG